MRKIEEPQIKIKNVVAELALLQASKLTQHKKTFSF